MLLYSWLQRLTSAFCAATYSRTGRRHQRPLPHGAARVELLEQRLCPSLLGLATSFNDAGRLRLSQVVDPLQGTVTSVGSSFPTDLFQAAGSFAGASALDPVNHRYYLQGPGFTLESPLFVVDTRTGNLLASPVVPRFASLGFDVA